MEISATDYQYVNWLITYPINDCIQVTQEIQGSLLVRSVERNKKVQGGQQ